MSDVQMCQAGFHLASDTHIIQRPQRKVKYFVEKFSKIFFCEFVPYEHKFYHESGFQME